MAVTCSFKKSYGHIIDPEGNRYDLWSGGNCLLVATTGKHHQYLQYFISDIQHLKNMAKDDLLDTCIKRICLYDDQPSLKSLVKYLTGHCEIFIKHRRKAK